MKNLKGFLIWGAVIGSIVMFTIVFFAVSYWYKLNVKSDAIETSRNIADMTFNTLYYAMGKGWKVYEIKGIIESERELFKKTPYSIEIYRSEGIERIYGKSEQPQMDNIVSHTHLWFTYHLILSL